MRNPRGSQDAPARARREVIPAAVTFATAHRLRAMVALASGNGNNVWRVYVNAGALVLSWANRSSASAIFDFRSVALFEDQLSPLFKENEITCAEIIRNARYVSRRPPFSGANIC